MQIGISLFAMPQEISEWIRPLVSKYGLHFALIRSQPNYMLVPLLSWSAFEQTLSNMVADELWIGLSPFYSSCNSQTECTARYPKKISFRLPCMRDGEFYEGNLAVVTEDENYLKTCRSIVGKLRRMTKGGMWVANRAAKGYYRNMHFSPRTEELYRSGVGLRPFAGGNTVHIDEPDLSTFG
jgi:hypothetical protein